MSDDADDTREKGLAREERCRKCGAAFELPEGPGSDIGTDCPGCHLCYSCADNLCPVCGE